MPLNVVIIGAGIGGTAAAVTLCQHGHNVTLLETAPKMLEVGAGIQVAPNMLLLLDRWGVGNRVRQTSIALQETHILRWQNGELLTAVPSNVTYGEQFVVHRADLHNALLEKALEMPNFRLKLSSTVVSVDVSAASATLTTGEIVKGDVLLGADGIKSMVRGHVIAGEPSIAVPTGDAVFRVMLHRDQMINDEELRPFIEERKVTRWIGPGGHVVAYPVKNHQLYNVALAHPDRGGLDESWTKVGSKKNLLDEYRGWDPRLVKMLSLVPDIEVLEWKLCVHPPLSRWISGKCALLGDACHPMLPYIAQGAAQAVEDAAALGVILSALSSTEQIPSALKVYEQVRKSRAETIQQLGGNNGKMLHLPDGPEQEERDKRFKNVSTLGDNPDRWGDMATQKMIWGCDSEKAAQDAWQGRKAGMALSNL